MLQEILGTVIQFTGAILGFLFVLRFVMQATQVNFFNPIAQGVANFTDVMLKPLRLVLRPIGRFDIASLVAVMLVSLAVSVSLRTLAGAALPDPITLLTIAGANVVRDIATLYLLALFVRVIISWIAPQNPHPGIELIVQITEPLLAPIRRVLPPMGGLDFSVMILLLVFYIITNVLLRPIPVV